MPGHSNAHPDSPLVIQVEFVPVWLSLAPAVHEVALDLPVVAILVPPGAILHPKPVEARGDLAPLLVEVNNPAVKLLNLIQEILMVGGGGPLSSNQTNFGGFRTVATTNSFLV